MRDQKPIYKILICSALSQGLYLLVLALTVICYKPVLLFSGFTMEQAEKVHRPVPFLLLGENFLLLILTCCLCYGIYKGIQKDSRLILSSVLSFIFIGLSPVLNWLTESLQNIVFAQDIISYEPGMEISAFSYLTGFYQRAYPLHFASMILLAVGTALALYRRRYGALDIRQPG